MKTNIASNFHFTDQSLTKSSTNDSSTNLRRDVHVSANSNDHLQQQFNFYGTNNTYNIFMSAAMASSLPNSNVSTGNSLLAKRNILGDDEDE